MSFKSAIFFIVIPCLIAYFGRDIITQSDIYKTHLSKYAEQLGAYFTDQNEVTKSAERSGKEVKEQKTKTEKEILFTKEELWKYYRGGDGSKGLYIGFMGKVYDVAKGAKYYGPGGGYDFFAGRDGTRAFSTGEFNEKGLIDDISGMPLETYSDFESWEEFYAKDYSYVGKVIGNFYDENGQPTEALKEARQKMEEAREKKALDKEHEKKLPRCNSEWTKETGTRFWCTKKSGGVDRDWIGVPRNYHVPGRKIAAYCVCVRDKGPPTLETSTENLNRGDLDNPHLKEFEGCDPTSVSCRPKK